MDEVDKLYNEWRKEERIKAEHMHRYCMDVYQNQCEGVPEYIRSRIVSETSKTLNQFIEDNKNITCSVLTDRYIKYAKEELKKRANKRSELAAQVKDAQRKTRKETFLEQPAEQNELNSGSMAETKTIRTEGRKTNEFRKH